ncbi:MAG: 50S ribosomal protein L16 [Candidatus Aenigmatarchaeota archaeon]|nr:50S ribosomal protein L16 [Nanoarchaeota archaeon]
MASLRPARCYRKHERPNTRVSIKKPRRSYIKGVPDSKIHRFEVGNRSRKFKKYMDLTVNNNVQIRHNALEAARVSANKVLSLSFGPDNYMLKILVYPHHVMRENPLASGAGADRFQTGMRKSFGKMIGRAARVKSNQRVVRVYFDDTTKINSVKRALTLASAKLPSPCRIVEAK